MVTLSWYEHELAASTGVKRVVESRRRGKAQHKPMAGNPLEGAFEQNDINAAGAEMAVAKLLNRYWPGGVNTFQEPDVGKTIEVRWTEHHSLLVRDRDHDDRSCLRSGGLDARRRRQAGPLEAK